MANTRLQPTHILNTYSTRRGSYYLQRSYFLWTIDQNVYAQNIINDRLISGSHSLGSVHLTW